MELFLLIREMFCRASTLTWTCSGATHCFDTVGELADVFILTDLEELLGNIVQDLGDLRDKGIELNVDEHSGVLVVHPEDDRLDAELVLEVRAEQRNKQTDERWARCGKLT